MQGYLERGIGVVGNTWLLATHDHKEIWNYPVCGSSFSALPSLPPRLLLFPSAPLTPCKEGAKALDVIPMRSPPAACLRDSSCPVA